MYLLQYSAKLLANAHARIIFIFYARQTNSHTNETVLWKITPFFASWIAQPGNLLAKCGVLSTPANPTTTVLELGCGISGLVSLALANRVKKYVNTDQDYVLKLVRENVGENYDVFSANGTNKNKKVTKHNSKTKVTNAQHTDNRVGNIITRSLDWETSDLSSLYRELDIEHLDLLISCDCIYNEALVEPLVTTMRDICRLASSQEEPTIVVVAQQLRASDVLETWLTAFCTYFRCWRVPDGELSEELREGSGYVVHIGILK